MNRSTIAVALVGVAIENFNKIRHAEYMAHFFRGLNKSVQKNGPLNQLFKRLAKRLAGRVVDAVLPPLCLNCDKIVDAPGVFCPACWVQLDFIPPSKCAACGLPFEMEVEPNTLCGGCLRRPPQYQRARAALVYNDHSKGLVLAFKYADRLDTARGLAALMVRAGDEVLTGADLITPVPLHWSRLFSRRYNQSAVLAKEIADITGVPICQNLITRHRRTPSQGTLGARSRQKNVRSAFSIRTKMKSIIAGKRIVLIDDVMTTSATVSACARTLQRHGVANVDVLTLARVVRPRRTDRKEP